MSDWLYMRLGDTEPVRFPDGEGVREFYEARGWEVVEAPADGPFVPAPDRVPASGTPGDTTGFVDLGHPDTGAVHRFPADPDALTGAHDAGWTALNRDGSVPKRQKPLDAALDAPVDPEPAPTAEPPDPDAAPAPEKPPKRPSSAANTKEQ